jgi:hypothetical protein
MMEPLKPLKTLWSSTVWVVGWTLTLIAMSGIRLPWRH